MDAITREMWRHCRNGTNPAGLTHYSARRGTSPPRFSFSYRRGCRTETSNSPAHIPAFAAHANPRPAHSPWNISDRRAHSPAAPAGARPPVKPQNEDQDDGGNYRRHQKIEESTTIRPPHRAGAPGATRPWLGANAIRHRVVAAVGSPPWCEPETAARRSAAAAV